VVGNGGFAVRCLKLMRDTHGCEVSLVMADPNAQVLHGVLEKYCEASGLPLLHAPAINEAESLTAVRAAEPEFLFNAYSMQLLGPALLDIPSRGAINFHNGPLPRYRGVNVYSWAIINGETEYGVTWHLMEDRIDAGDIVAQRMFGVGVDATPTTLMQRGFDAGVEALDELLTAIGHGSLPRNKQDEGRATYYSRRKLANGGLLDFSWSFERLERFVRGLDFRPLPNTFVRPSVTFGGTRFHPQRIRLAAARRELPTGYVTKIDDAAVEVQASDAVVALAELLDAELAPVTPRQLAANIGLAVGDRLA
jgi:methionyl-tRNA formyltransferase